MNINGNKYRLITFIISGLCLIATTVFLIIVWEGVPEVVAGHYNFAGEVDGTTDKTSLILFLGLGWAGFIGLSVLMKFPQVWNTGVKITPENRYRVYKILGDMLSTVRLIMALIFCNIVVQSSAVIKLPNVFMPAMTILLFGSMAIFGVKLFRAR